MDWTNELILDFLKLYRSHACIWDPKNDYHNSRHKVIEAWENISERLNVPIPELKRKKESLMSAYRTCKMKIKKSERLTNGNIYIPSWFAFSFMDSFLGENYNATHGPENADKRDHGYGRSEDRRDSLIGEDDITKDTNYSSKGRKKNKRSFKPEPKEEPQDDVEEDECDLYARLLVIKLRRLPEHIRNLMMLKIDKLMYESSLNISSNYCASSTSYTDPLSSGRSERIHLNVGDSIPVSGPSSNRSRISDDDISSTPPKVARKNMAKRNFQIEGLEEQEIILKVEENSEEDEDGESH